MLIVAVQHSLFANRLLQNDPRPKDDTMELTRLIDGIDFGEGPRWHDGRLWYSDFYQQTVYTVTPEGGRETVFVLDDQPSGLGWLPNGDLLIVAMRSKRLLRFDGEKTTVHADLSALAEGLCNDMVVSAGGHAYVGNFGFDFEAGESLEATRLIHVSPDGRAERVGDELKFPNGAVITPDESTLIVGESMGGQYRAFDIESDGSLSGGRVWASVIGLLPDGCALDSEGLIWFADAGPGQQVCRVAEGGDILERVPTPDPTFACMLGGADGKTLFVLTAPGSAKEDVAGKARGAIWTTRVDAPGAGLP
jgi:sugar lactone lactonase YvrE